MNVRYTCNNKNLTVVNFYAQNQEKEANGRNTECSEE